MLAVAVLLLVCCQTLVMAQADEESTQNSASETAAPFSLDPIPEPAVSRPGFFRLHDRARELSLRLPGRRTPLTRLASSTGNMPGKEPEPGDIITFQVDKAGGEKKRPLAAVLKVVGRHCLIFIELGYHLPDARLQRIARTFDQHIYPRTVATFGSEFNPGIDGDPRITLLLLHGMEGSDGLFYPGDEYPVDEEPGSNQREMLYLSIERLADADDFMGHLVAHELQHMIHWHHDDNEVYWVEEGLSEYAATLFNHLPWTAAQFFLNPDRSLFAWEDAREYANYGHVFLFFDYLFSRPELGEDGRIKLIHEIVSSKEIGDRGVAQALASVGSSLTFAGVFRDFSAATFLHDAYADPHPYKFSAFVSSGLEEYEQSHIAPRQVFDTATGTASGKVHMWSTAGYQFSLQNPPELLTLSFAGRTIETCKGSNVFWVGLAMIDTSQQQPPEVIWLPTDNNNLTKTVDFPPGYDRLLLLVCNLGPLNYLDGDGTLPKASYRFSLTDKNARVSPDHASNSR